MRPLLLAAGIALLSGCYLSHERRADGPDGAAPHDAARPIDAVPSRDAARRDDAGPILPIEVEPDPGPDEPPTGPWTDVPPPPVGSVVLVPVGDVVRLDEADERFDQGGPPTLVWNGAGWGVTWPGRFLVLDADGVPVTARATTSRRTASNALAFAAGRYAVVVARSIWEPGPMTLGAFDRSARLAAGWEDASWRLHEIGHDVDIARLEIAHQWVLALSTETSAGGAAHPMSVVAANDEMELVGDPIELTRDGYDGVRITSATTRALVTWVVEDGVMAQVVVGPPLALEGEPFRVMPLSGSPGASIGTQLFRDQVVVTAMDGGDNRIAFVDPWEHAITVGPFIAGTSFHAVRPAMAVAPERGFVVACWGTGRHPPLGPGNDDGVALQIIGPDGALWGERLDLVGGQLNLAGVDCGWNGTDIVVVWWRASGGGGSNAMFTQRARPTFL